MWRCTVRNKKTNCLALATVHQTGETFIIGPKDHAHGPVTGVATSLAVKAKVNINDTNI